MNDWEAFVREISKVLGRNPDKSAAAENYAEKPVVWTGKVAEKRFNKRLGIDRPGVQMDMPAIDVELPDGGRATVDYLFLTLKEGEKELWRNVEIGVTLRFATQIRKSSGPFSGIRWTDLDDKRGAITFMTDGGIPLIG